MSSTLPELTVNDVLGIIQRQLLELNAYVSQAPQHVDPKVIMHYLERAAVFADKLEQNRPAPTAQPEARAN